MFPWLLNICTGSGVEHIQGDIVLGIVEEDLLLPILAFFCPSLVDKSRRVDVFAEACVSEDREEERSEGLFKMTLLDFLLIVSIVG